VDEPSEEIPPFDVGHSVGFFDGRDTLGYLKFWSSMRARYFESLDPLALGGPAMGHGRGAGAV
jgi:hypothetical protein